MGAAGTHDFSPFASRDCFSGAVLPLSPDMKSEPGPSADASAHAAPPSREARRPGREFLRHARTLARTKLLRRWYRLSFPLATPFFDGQERWTRRSIHRMFNLWLKEQGSANEAWAAYDHYRGGDVIDIGASEGFFSLLLGPKSLPGSRHICLEPDAKSFARLLDHLAEAKRLFPEVDFIPLAHAAGDGRPGIVNVLSGHRELPTHAIDTLVEFFGLRPDFIKIDVEGYEWTVLQGMEKTLRDFSPVLHLELHPKYLPAPVTVETVEAWLRERGYASTEIDRAALSLRQMWRRTESVR